MNKVINHINLVLLIACSLFWSSCKTTLPTIALNNKAKKQQVDYSDINNWAAHPDKDDMADMVPESDELADQSAFEVDVFYIHPTTYTGKKGHNQWNASIDDIKLNEATDESPVKYQASIFNQSGKVFAPRYRQAHIFAYQTEHKEKAKDAFELAYHDVKTAFEYFMKHENKGRPFILASHSQGTTHSKRLIKELIDGKAIQEQLVAAYIIGIPVGKAEFDSLLPCENASDINCIISWRTFKKDHFPNHFLGDEILVTNPLSWKIDKEYVDKAQNKGAILRNFNKILKGRVDAQVSNGVLWANKPKFPWSFLFTRDNYHIADMNFYYFNIQENAKQRVASFLAKKSNSDD